jgi:hypothetical protein
MNVMILNLNLITMIKSKNTAKKQSSISAQIAYMKEFMDSPGWKLIEKEFDKVISQIKENLRKPCTDQSLKFNANNLLSERIASLYIAKNIPSILLNDFENILS